MNEDKKSSIVAKGSKRKAAATASLNISKRYASCFKRVSSLVRKKSKNALSEDEALFLEKNSELVAQFYKRKEKRAECKNRLNEHEDSPVELEEKCQNLAQAIHDSEFLIIYTGAGISTSASIPDYRGPNGIWTRLQKGQDIGTHDLTTAEPTVTHMAVSKLYSKGIVRHVVSQNCDGLHLRSGLPKTALSEVHGNMYIEVCKRCKPTREYVRTFDVTEKTSTFKHKTGRRCYRCGEPLVDTIVHFGERGKLRWPLNWQGACQAAKACDTILCLGSSLKVLKKYPWLWQMERPLKRRPRLYIVNLQWTPKDKDATIKINGKCDEVMDLVMKNLGLQVPPYMRLEDPIFSMETPLHSEELSSCTQPALIPPEDDDSDCSSSTRPNSPSILTPTLPSQSPPSHHSNSPPIPSKSPAVVKSQQPPLLCKPVNPIQEQGSISESSSSLRHMDKLFSEQSCLEKTLSPSNATDFPEDPPDECKPKLKEEVKEENIEELKPVIDIKIDSLVTVPVKEEDEYPQFKDNFCDSLDSKKEPKMEPIPELEEKSANEMVCVSKVTNISDRFSQFPNERTQSMNVPKSPPKWIETSIAPQSIIKISESLKILQTSPKRNECSQTLKIYPSVERSSKGCPSQDKEKLENVDCFLLKPSAENIIFNKNLGSPIHVSDSLISRTNDSVSVNQSKSLNINSDISSCWDQVKIDIPKNGKTVHLNGISKIFSSENLSMDKVLPAVQLTEATVKNQIINSIFSPNKKFMLSPERNSCSSVDTIEGNSKKCLKKINFYGTGLCIRSVSGFATKLPVESMKDSANGNYGVLNIPPSVGSNLSTSINLRKFSPRKSEVVCQIPLSVLTSPSKNGKNNSFYLQTEVIDGVIQKAEVKPLSAEERSGSSEVLNSHKLMPESSNIISDNISALENISSGNSMPQTNIAAIKSQENISHANNDKTDFNEATCGERGMAVGNNFSINQTNKKRSDSNEGNYVCEPHPKVLDSDLKRLWFWGFDSSPKNNDSSASIESLQENDSGSENAPPNNSYAEEDVKKESPSDSNPDEMKSSDESHKRVTRSSRVKEPRRQKCNCSTSNPSLCDNKSREKIFSPECGMLRVRESIKRRRINNYSSYSPVFEVRLDDKIYHEPRIKKKKKYIEEYYDSCDEEEIEEETPDIPEDTKKKTGPGWYGKGCRKGMKKKKHRYPQTINKLSPIDSPETDPNKLP